MIRLLEGVMSYQGGIRAREGNIRPLEGGIKYQGSIRPLDGGGIPP